jgi:hypothetical protein
VYVLDANIIFASAVQTAWFMMVGEELPEMKRTYPGRLLGRLTSVNTGPDTGACVGYSRRDMGDVSLGG